jgi:gas vesicle protein
VSEKGQICAGAAIGALVGAAAAYLFLTDQGRTMRDRLEPAVDQLIHDFDKFRQTIEKVSGMANDGLRALQEFQNARSQHGYGGTAH